MLQLSVTLRSLSASEYLKQHCADGENGYPRQMAKMESGLSPERAQATLSALKDSRAEPFNYDRVLKLNSN
jgi:hypothetical protein